VDSEKELIQVIYEVDSSINLTVTINTTRLSLLFLLFIYLKI
jgi:hypothetical protein